MPDNVVTMSGTKLQTIADLADWLKAGYESGEFEHVVMVITRRDGLTELAYNRQEHRDVVFAASVLFDAAMQMAGSSVSHEE